MKSLVLALLAGFRLIAVGQFTDPDVEDARLAEAAAATCFRVISATYDDSLLTSRRMESAVRAFAAAPSEESLATARRAWFQARRVYALTEAFRFSGGPIDDEDGPEEWLNAWPLDESVIDRVPESPVVSIIENAADYPVIDSALLVRLNMKEGEKNITCGWHAVEFLLWGQDTSADGPGNRPVSDFSAAPHADRRCRYLEAAASGVVSHLETVASAWRKDGGNNYRAAVEARPADESLRSVVKGMIMLAGFELASERIGVPCETRLQEEEQSCFSDTTSDDIRGNIAGIVNLWKGRYVTVAGQKVGGISLQYLTKVRDAALARELDARIADVEEAASRVPDRFDNAVVGAPDAPGQLALRDLAAKLTALAVDLRGFAARMGRPFTAAELEG
jgi:putative iron-regulated protein